MTTDDAQAPALRPGRFCQLLLNAMAASEGRRRKRKRDTTPDALGMGLKRDLMAQAAEADPEPDAFEAWLLRQALAAPAGGPTYAMCAEILDEYRAARLDPGFERWLASGAYSEDAAEEEEPQDGGGRRDGAGGRKRGPGWREDQYAREASRTA
jgi:hypothetical protein